MTARRTIRRPLTVRGTALFTATPVRIDIRPALAGSGITFRRVDLPSRPTIPARVDAITDAPVHPAFAHAPPRCTSIGAGIGAGEARVSTIEHLMGALAGLGISDAEVELDAPELPILDGSARRFVELIRAVGVQTLEETIDPIILTDRLEVTRDAASIVAEPTNGPDAPSPGALYEYYLDYGVNPAIQPQSASWTPAAPDAHDRFAEEIAPARTFCLDTEAAQLRQAGLFTHLSPRDMLVLGATGPIDNDLRFENEPARHKLLDLIGDLALIQRPIRARIVATRSGHALNHELAALLLERFG